MNAASEPVMSFSEKNRCLDIHSGKLLSDMIDITVLNSRAEAVIRMKLICGSHRIDLSSLKEKEYLIRLVAGDNVWVQKISFHF